MKTSLFFGLVLTSAIAGAVYAANPADPPQPQDPQRPKVVAKADPVTEQKPAPDERVEDKVAFTTKPVLRSGQDIGLKDITVATWSRDGTRLALQGKDESLSIPNPNAKAAVPENVKRSTIAIYLVQLKGAGIEKTGRVLSRLVPTGSLVGFSPNGAELITDRREFGLISGLHQLQYHTLEARELVGGVGAPPSTGFLATKRETVELEAAEAHGYHFAADGKTFRTLAFERDGAGAAAKLRVVEVDAATGKPLKTLLTVDYTQYELSPNGKRLATFEKGETVTFYDVDRGAKLASANLPPPLVVPKPKGGFPAGGFGQPAEPLSPRLISAFSPDGQLLVVSFGIGVTAVYRSQTAEALPKLDGLDLCRTSFDSYPFNSPFSGDGRLLALGGTRYVTTTAKLPRGEEQVAYSHAGNFLTVWDTRTGKVLKSWDRSARASFNPVGPLLAILEPNDAETRIGLWDFAAEVERK